MRKDCDYIVKKSIEAVLPDAAVRRALSGKEFGSGRLLLVAIGKAAWSMAAAASDILGDKLDDGIVITKHGYSKGDIPGLQVYEAGHPVPDADTFTATEAVLKLTDKLTEKDTVLFLVSGGGSALFESPKVSAEELTDITNRLLACGADIVQMNIIRKRLSNVKGGRFALHCAPAKVYSIVLSDIIGDPLDMIASGPAYPDSSTAEDAYKTLDRLNLSLSSKVMELLKEETPKSLDNVETVITGSVTELCRAAKDACEELGYKTVILTDCLNCEAREAGRLLGTVAKTWSRKLELKEKAACTGAEAQTDAAASDAKTNADAAGSVAKSNANADAGVNTAADTIAYAFIAGGETIVHIKGSGKGGRNQELALSAALELDGLENAAVFSVGSDGSDGPTDAAGGFADGSTVSALKAKGISAYDSIENSDSYNALKACGGLIVTGATGTNVNDVAVVLVKKL